MRGKINWGAKKNCGRKKIKKWRKSASICVIAVDTGVLNNRSCSHENPNFEIHLQGLKFKIGETPWNNKY
jgi:hypothetical protein